LYESPGGTLGLLMLQLKILVRAISSSIGLASAGTWTEYLVDFHPF
uniref:Pecanex-like protein n=1 Tax=Haemonchus placei TaxID=6290 RepID=A0A0N4WWU0_HAEPC